MAMQLASVLVSNVLRLSSTLTTGVSHTRTCSSSGEQETQRNGTLYVHVSTTIPCTTSYSIASLQLSGSQDVKELH